MKVAFLYFDNIHHVFHSVTIAFALSRTLGPGHTVDLLTITDDCEALLTDFCRRTPDHDCRVVRLATPLSHRLWGQLRRRFPRKSRILKKHAAQLAGYDALVGTDYTTGRIRRVLGARTPELIFTSHGAGDRAYGYREELKAFDLILAAGEKVRQRSEAVGLRDGAECHVTGYAKFDTDLATYSDRAALFPDTASRLTVIYNPHFAAHLSSWPKLGAAVLDYFARSDRFNLIFAPHIMLFDPRHGNRIEPRWQNLPDVHIDTGSLASSDMSYTRLADVYLGDVSSQSYEFISQPRPCIFLNAHGVDWQNDINYLSWQGGAVIEATDDLASRLDTLLTQPNSAACDLSRQTQLLDETFSVTGGVSASQRSADCIVEFMQRRTP